MIVDDSLLAFFQGAQAGVLTAAVFIGASYIIAWVFDR